MAKRNRTSNTVVSEPMDNEMMAATSSVAVVDVPATDTPSESEPIELNDNESNDGSNDDSNESNDDNESESENESESKSETLSEMLERITNEKIAAIEKQKSELESQHAAILANVTSDAVRLVAVDLLNSDSFELPDGIKLETGKTIGLALEYNVDSKSWSMAVDAVVKLPRVRTVATGSESPTAQNTIWFTSFTSPTGTKHDAPMLIKNDGTVSETRNDLAACALILGFDIKNNGQYTMNAGAKQKRLTENGWSFETAQNFQS
jgi:hypothetical protein